MLRKMIGFLVVTGLLAMSVTADAALMAYLYAKGGKTGPVKGSVTQKGREGSIAIIAFDQATKQEVSPNGAATGRMRVGQVTITKEVDKSSPILRQMMNNQEPITDATIQFWTPNIMGAGGGMGVEVQYYTLLMSNARITSMKTVMLNMKNPAEMQYPMFEVLTISYEKADWTWTNGALVATEMNGNALP